jgi:hypothetical protein
MAVMSGRQPQVSGSIPLTGSQVNDGFTASSRRLRGTGRGTNVRQAVYHALMSREPTGHIERLPSGSYRVSVYAGTDPLSRRPIRFRATARTETQARIELGKLLEKARDGRSPEAGVTMAKLLDEYAPLAQWDVSTRQTNEGFIRRTLNPAIGHLKIRQVNGGIVDKLYARLRASVPA